MKNRKRLRLIDEQELRDKIDKDLKYDIGGTIVCIMVALGVLLFYPELITFWSFIIMALVFYNSYLITKREKQILEVFK